MSDQINVTSARVAELKFDENNLNQGTDVGRELLEQSLRETGAGRSVLVDKNMRLIGGNKTKAGAEAAGIEEAIIIQTTGDRLVVVQRTDLDLETDDKAKRLALFDNRVSELDLNWDAERLAILAQENQAVVDGIFSDDDIESLLNQANADIPVEQVDVEHKTLSEQFVVVPFSTLDSRQEYWQDRRRAWISLGIKGELNNKNIFDPVLCEIIYRWFSTEGGAVLDPFAGGSVRGIVASILDREYDGIDLREEQIIENRTQADKICKGEHKPTWYVGNSLNLPELLPEGKKYDLLFSCPPYYDLEVYSNEEGDLSGMGTYQEFMTTYSEIIARAATRLKDNSFAVFVVGDIRNRETGYYRNFVSDTIKAFTQAGMQLYNEAILVHPAGALTIRVGRQFRGYRKLGKSHQNILVFFNGDPNSIAEKLGHVQCGDIGDYYDQG